MYYCVSKKILQCILPLLWHPGELCSPDGTGPSPTGIKFNLLPLLMLPVEVRGCTTPPALPPVQILQWQSWKLSDEWSNTGKKKNKSVWQ